MAKSIPNIVYDQDYCKSVVDGKNPYESISLYKPIEYFDDCSPYEKFIENVERMIRTSDDYSAFIRQLKEVVGLNFCQVSSQIFDTDARIEMHHGPLFTLYDYVEIILTHFIRMGKKINEFLVADQVIEEHFAKRVQVVMLAVTNHEAVHNRDLFLNIKQGFGDVSSFIERYKPEIEILDELKAKIWNFLDLCKNTESFDSGYLDIRKVSRLIPMDNAA